MAGGWVLHGVFFRVIESNVEFSARHEFEPSYKQCLTEYTK